MLLVVFVNVVVYMVVGVLNQHFNYISVLSKPKLYYNPPLTLHNFIFGIFDIIEWFNPFNPMR